MLAKTYLVHKVCKIVFPKHITVSSIKVLFLKALLFQVNGSGNINWLNYGEHLQYHVDFDIPYVPDPAEMVLELNTYYPYRVKGITFANMFAKSYP